MIAKLFFYTQAARAARLGAVDDRFTLEEVALRRARALDGYDMPPDIIRLKKGIEATLRDEIAQR